MVISVDAKETLKRMCYDIDQMIIRNEDPKTVLKMIRKKLLYLEGQKDYYKVRWWNDTTKRRKVIKKDIEKDIDDEIDYEIDGVTKY